MIHIDFHTHAYPEISTLSPLKTLRAKIQKACRPLWRVEQHAMRNLRKLPQPVRRGIEELAAPSILPALLINSNIDDLLQSMRSNDMNKALVVAHPPLASNEFVLELCQQHDHLLPVLYVNGKTKESSIEKVKLPKFHPMAEGLNENSLVYRRTLELANKEKTVVIIHSGQVNSHLLFKNPDLGNPTHFERWFEEYKNVTFVLAHMNIHEPEVSLELMEKHLNVYTTTSWQPSASIARVISKIGADRILYASDWPLIGGNMEVGISRLQNLAELGRISQEDLEMVLGKNAQHLLDKVYVDDVSAKA